MARETPSVCGKSYQLHEWEWQEYQRHVAVMHSERKQKEFALRSILRIANALNATDAIVAAELLDVIDDCLGMRATDSVSGDACLLIDRTNARQRHAVDIARLKLGIGNTIDEIPARAAEPSDLDRDGEPQPQMSTIVDIVP